MSNVPEKLDQPGRPEEFEKSNLEQLCHVDDAADNGDKVKGVPRVLEVVLKRKMGISLLFQKRSELLIHLWPERKHLEAALDGEEGGEEKIAIGEDVNKVEWSLISVKVFTKTKTKTKTK